VEFAEDQLWAMQIIEAGYHKAYAPDAVVYHSHDYGLFERMQRSFDEARAFKALFSYVSSGSILEAGKAVAVLSRNDLCYICPMGAAISRRERLWKLLDNLMLVLGHYLGQRSDRMPDFFCRALSRDKRLFAQR
jgi:rhamnosyltransferase